jgi:hypothetical protein
VTGPDTEGLCATCSDPIASGGEHYPDPDRWPPPTPFAGYTAGVAPTHPGCCPICTGPNESGEARR